MLYEPTTGRKFATAQEFRLAYPNTSFGGLTTEPERNEVGLFTLTHNRPDYDRALQELVLGPVVLQGGGYVQTYTVQQLPLTPAQVQTIMIARFDAALTAHLDQTAQQRRYDNRITCMVRAGFAGPFQAEGQAFATWCDTCNVHAYQVLEDVQLGVTPMPTIEAFLASLPPMVWPT